MKAIVTGILAALVLGGASAAVADDPWSARPTIGEPRDYGWGPGIDLNEIKMRLVGGYGGENVDRAGLRVAKRLTRATIYAHPGDLHPSGKSRLYVDRDGDGTIDAGALYNPDTGVLSADWDCNGTGDQIIVDLKPPTHSLVWALEHPNQQP